MEHTSIAANDQEKYNLNREADPIAQQHNTVDRPLPPSEHQRPGVARRLEEKILEGRWSEVEQSQTVVTDVICVIAPYLPSARLVPRIELVRSYGHVVLGGGRRRRINVALPWIVRVWL